MIYMGCVTDIEFDKALLEQYPDRAPNSKDSMIRRQVSQEKQDVYELAQAFQRREHMRYFKS